MKLSGRNTEVVAGELSIGCTVRIRSREEISRSLDSSKRCDGCIMMDQMWDYCEQEHRILKVVNNFFDEHESKMYGTRAPLYILDGLICKGSVDSFDKDCDRSCWFLWHAQWLEKT